MRLAIFAALLLTFPVAAQQQDNSQQTQSSNSAAQKKNDQQGNQQQKKNQQSGKAADRQNAFPEAQSEQAPHEAQQDNGSAQQQDKNNSQQEPAAPQPATPQSAPGAQPKKPSSADANPFPEAESEKAAHQAEQQPSSPGSNAPQSDDYSSSQDRLKGLDLTGLGDTRTADGAGGTILSPELGRKDTKVGEFYLHSGDYKGAYDRFAEATKVDPGNAQAVFDLAEAARHLNHRDEAVRNYRLYLSALPDGPRSKDARKALKDLGAQPNS